MDRIAEQINKAHTETKSVIVVLENMAGAGGSVGHKFEYLHHIIDKVKDKARVGVCLDTCHLFAGGYDVSSPEAFEQVMTEFEEVVGLQYLKGMHVNDSKAALGSKKDRHENVAKGLIGKDCFTFLMNDDRFNGIPLIMETPVQCEGPHIDYKLSLLAGGPVYKGPSEAETGINTDKRDIAWLNSLSRD
jgi:apurinic endonuclease APN1